MLLHDRTLEFHSQYGRHHRLRVPKCLGLRALCSTELCCKSDGLGFSSWPGGRSITYDSESCTLFCGWVFARGVQARKESKHRFKCWLRTAAALRLDLEAGTFLTPIEMQKMSEVNEVVMTFACRVTGCSTNHLVTLVPVTETPMKNTLPYSRLFPA